MAGWISGAASYKGLDSYLESLNKNFITNYMQHFMDTRAALICIDVLAFFFALAIYAAYMVNIVNLSILQKLHLDWIV
jgi:hypothetical protein